MKSVVPNKYPMFTVMSEEETAFYNRRIQEERSRIPEYKKKNVTSALKEALCYIIFKPIALALNVMSVVAKLIGSALSFGMPYGIYRIIRSIVSLSDGAELADIAWWPVWWFVALPFIAFTAEVIFDKIADFAESRT